MSEHPNVALHRKAHAAFSRGDMDMLTQMIAEDTVWHSAGKSLISGDFRGREAVLGGFFAKLDEVSGGTAKFVEHQGYLGNAEHSVALFRFAATRSDKNSEFRVRGARRYTCGRFRTSTRADAGKYPRAAARNRCGRAMGRSCSTATARL